MQTAKPTNLRLDLTSDLQKWRTFLAIAELGSLTRAALFLDSNQSLLSRQLNALERECSARLFNRTGRGVALTDIGQRVFPHVKALLTDAEQLELEIRGEAREPTGRVTIGSLPSITNPIVGRLFQQLRRRHPAIQLKILEGSSGQVEEWMADARIDIAILYRYGKILPTHEQHLATVDSYLIGADGDKLTAAQEIPFSALNGLPFILPGAPNGLRTALDATARQEHITLTPVIEADSLPLMRSTVAEARLYTVLPIHAVWTEVKEGRLQAAKIVSPALQRTVSMELTRTKGPAKAVQAVANEIVAIVEEAAASGMWRAGDVAQGDMPVRA
ncbi:MAG TPA: LysR substrate-binding domain-containing protein [Burkholderiaceae bacterium]|nr:LysR substrate-binding domain-containing protein [Burkholderiaceae bacterium]